MIRAAAQWLRTIAHNKDTLLGDLIIECIMHGLLLDQQPVYACICMHTTCQVGIHHVRSDLKCNYSADYQ